METFTDSFYEIFQKCGLDRYATSGNAALFERLTVLLLEENQKINLTAIKEPREIIVKHYADSVLSAHLLPEGATLLDVGCGGGFPTLPLAIVRPDLSITALDATAKKLVFVDKAAKELSLKVKTLQGRAEELALTPLYREKFDAVSARAVAELRILSEWCLPFVRKGGVFLALKGASGREELQNAQNAVRILGGSVEKAEEYSLEEAKRVNILVRKVSSTKSNYPRKNAQIKKEPL